MKIVLMMLIAFCCYSRPAVPPGLFIGIPYGKPFPSGTYFSDLPTYISIPSRTKSPSANVFYHSSSLAYVPKFKILRATPFVGGSISEAFYRSKGGHAWIGNLYNPSFGGGLQWLITPHFGISNMVSILPPMNTQGLSIDAWTFGERAAMTYFNNNAQATVHFFYGFMGPNQSSTKPNNPDFIELDFTCIRFFKRLSLGPIAFGSWDTTLAKPWSQFAVGGIMGYNFGQFGLQFWLAHDTNANHWGNYATTGFLRIFIALEKQSQASLKKGFGF